MTPVALQFLLFSTWAGWYHPPIDVSRYAPAHPRLRAAARALKVVFASLALCGPVLTLHAAEPKPGPKTTSGSGPFTNGAPSRVVIAFDSQATEAFKPRPGVVQQLAAIGLTRLTGAPTPRDAWRSLVSTNDTVGIKVHSAPGADSGTRPALVAAFVAQLIAAGLPPQRIIVWDRQRADLRRAGYFELAEKYGVRVEGSLNAGYDPATFYDPDQPVVGPLLWSDLEFGKTGEGVGRRSYVSKLVREMTKIVIVTPLLNHNTAGVYGHLVSLALGSVDNVLRFESDFLHLKSAVPELFALPSLSDRVVLCVTDALVCQYEGEERGLLHYAVPLNEVRFSRDPVALDLLSLRELQRQRSLSSQPVPHHPTSATLQDLFDNAALLELGQADASKIVIEQVTLPANPSPPTSPNPAAP